jgi:chemotaxis protein methyltransferase CheR
MATTASISGQDLDPIRALIEQRSGVCFDSSRERFFSVRVREHLQAKGLASPADLMRRVLSSSVEYEALLQCLLTQETFFFRYPAAFEALKQRVLPEIRSRMVWDNPRTLRIWSAGCSTGEEPYSIAIALSESLSFAKAWNTEILATDISREALNRAARAAYSRRSLGNLTTQQIESYFVPAGPLFKVRPAIRRMVSFFAMSLTHALYLGRMDCIFCMNVLIYFAEERRNEVVRRFFDLLQPGGYLLLGPCETLSNIPVQFEKFVFDDYLLYRKPDGGNGASTLGRPL